MRVSSLPHAVVALGILGIAMPAAAETGAPGVGGVIGAVLLISSALATYFIPTIVANARAHTSTMGIAVLNLLLGWTILGWIVALVWAFSGKNNAAEASRQRYAQMMAARAGASRDAVTTCPFCAETVRASAIKCKHCGSALEPPPTLTTRS